MADSVFNTGYQLHEVQNGLAYIVGNTNTTGSTLAVGQFVYVKGHSTIAEGLRKVTASISANGSITTSNTSRCQEGGLNALNSKIVNLDSLKNRMQAMDISNRLANFKMVGVDNSGNPVELVLLFQKIGSTNVCQFYLQNTDFGYWNFDVSR